MMKKKAVTTLAAIAAAGLGGSAIAGATQSGNSDNGSSSSSGSTANRAAPPARPNETALTGETAAKVKAAALARVQGTVLRVETDQGGVYEAHVRKADGTEVEVKVDKSFAITAVQERGRGGPRGGRGPGGGPGAGERALTGETAAKVKAAALAKVDGTVLRVETDRGGVYEAHVRKADGTEVEVKVDKAFEVTAVEEHQAPPRR